MSTYDVVRIGPDKLTIKTTIATTQELVDEGVIALLSNYYNNHKRSIGIDVIMKRSPSTTSSTAVLLQLSDGHQCLIVRLHCFTKLPESLYNFLSLPAFTFAGFGIKETMSILKKHYGLLCKNPLEVGTSGLLHSRAPSLALGLRLSTLRSMHISASPSISDHWDAEINLTESMTRLAVSNAFAAFLLGENIL